MALRKTDGISCATIRKDICIHRRILWKVFVQQ